MSDDDLMDDDRYIVDEPLPDAVNFDVLKDEGIARLKALAGQVWTNFNESDPGVTILDQLCYALTELGYCAQFPIEDVLTRADGTINYDGQFFLPQDILTCSPVTPDDYRRLVHDRLAQVRAVYLVPQCTDSGRLSGRYLTYFCTDADEALVGARIDALLNQHRNLGEQFLAPQPLRPLVITLAGSVYLKDGADASAVYNRILQVLCEYEVPPVVQSGYGELRAQGFTADQIFNGPRLDNGWIGGPDALGAKRTAVSLYELNTLIAAVDGVSHLDGLAFTDHDGQEVAVADDRIPQLTPGPGFGLQGIGQPMARPLDAAALELASLRASHDAASVESQVDLAPDAPQGSYRNIEQYYSVQNTFPEIYGIGPNSLQSDTPSYRVASARQLKGYLLVYDQLLANEFAQLAHVGDLFSFAAPQPVEGGTAGERWPLHRTFCTTYHSQPLYDVPDVQALLRGSESFHYQLDPNKPDAQVERGAWKRYRNFPFNEYIHGLRAITETEDEAVRRRDAMLTHLMARHGDDASEYHPMFKATQWYGSELKTRVVVKSVWLQNYQQLSSHRTNGFNYQAADPLTAPGPFAAPGSVRAGPDDKIAAGILRNFSAFELKLAILLGLPAHLASLADKLETLLRQEDFLAWLRQGGDPGSSWQLKDTDVVVVRGVDSSGKEQQQLFDGAQRLMDIGPVSAESIGENTYRVHADQLAWLSTQRKGVLLVEHILLLPTYAFNDAGYYLAATLVLPAYVTLFQQAAFASYLDTLVQLHWPAHVRLRRLDASCTVLKPLIPLFVEWHNGLNASPAANAPDAVFPGPTLAKLLGIGKEVAHAA
ncbi:hypothetical protein NX773_19425 [Massilia solisilvae]|uniref:Uncharacterized protein n=1 Tax=Massilia solisilvae TaxID=1811225 RepID=A0ABT2BPD0_9BURK|nr:hypothetical protein [Massilia solisilvae]MCS0610342.1 hypothetical protein [Massilia solisilvae]